MSRPVDGDVGVVVPVDAPPDPETRRVASEGPDPLESDAVAVLERTLRADPNSFEFFQAVRLLERMRPGLAGVGGFAERGGEVATFTVEPSLSFPASEIQWLELDDEGPARMAVNFLGLVGPLGVLPHVYTLLVADTRRAGDDALGDFLDIFQHRLVSLFYRAWRKHRFTLTHEDGEPDPLTVHLLDLVGLGPERLRDLLPIRDEVLAYHAGLLAPVQRSAAALEALLEDYFGVRARVTSFAGAWNDLSSRDLCRLGEEVASARLGLGAVVGDEVWDPHAEVGLTLGPMDRARFEGFLPGGAAHRDLSALASFFAHGEVAFEVRLVLRREDVPRCGLGEEGEGTRLGWSTWLPRTPSQGDADDAVFAL